MKFLYRRRPLPLENLCLGWHLTAHADRTRTVCAVDPRQRGCRALQALPARHRTGFRQEHSHAGHPHAGHRPRLLRPVDRLLLRLRPAVTEASMTFDYSLAAAVTAALLIYLTYALLRPERF